MVDSIIETVTKKNRIKRMLVLVIGALIMGACYNAFVLPNHVVYGGLSGLSIFLQGVTGIKATIILNVGTYSLLVLSLFILGWKKTSYGLIGFIAYDLAINITAPLAPYLNVAFDSFFIKTVFFAFVEGIGFGLLYRTGFNTAGSDTVTEIAQHFLKKPIKNISTVMNGTIILLGFSQYGLASSLYALIYLLILNLVADYILLGNKMSRLVFISGHHMKDIEEYLTENMNLGYTLINSTNGIGFLNRPIIMCILPFDRFEALKNKIKGIDKHANIISTDCYTVEGGRTGAFI